MNDILMLTVFIILAVISPGPDFIVVTRNSLNHGKASGIYTALGVSSGALILALISIFGLALIIIKSPLLFSIIKYVGAAYLIYLGLRSILSAFQRKSLVAEESAQFSVMSHISSTKQGFLCSVLNPKSMLFFTALFSVVIENKMTIAIQMILGLEVSVIYLIWFILLAIIITHKPVKERLDRVAHYINTLLGILLTTVGFHVLSLSH